MAFKVYYQANLPKTYEDWLDSYTNEVFSTLAEAEARRQELIAYAGIFFSESTSGEVDE